jgi:calcium-dependent protein kinase
MDLKIKAANFVTQHAGKLRDHYRIGKMLGSGAFGEVRVCVHRESGAQRAVKVLRKSHMDDDEKKMLFNEINNLKDLDHPNILKMYEFFEDDKRYYIVTDICKGGELFDEIVARGKFSERDASMLLKQILSCINYCHQNNIVHRDLKPENVLLEQNKEFDQIKIIDFGTSLVFDETKKLDEKLGTPYYIAPEVLAKNYGAKCDIWSCGVITYIVLSGIPPFNGASDQEIMKKVKLGKFSFADPVWASISDSGKDFITKLLTKDQEKRPSAEQALQHPWIVQANELQREAVSSDMAMGALTNLQNFNAQSKLKQATFAFIASQLLSKGEKEQIDKVFRAMDANGDGKLSKEEIKNGYAEYFGRSLNDNEIDEMFDKVDSDKSGAIDYSEFVVATMNEKNLLSNNKLQTAFKMFDKDGGGSISVEEIKQVLSFGQNLDEEVVAQIISQVDANGDGEISFDEFAQMMLKNCE